MAFWWLGCWLLLSAPFVDSQQRFRVDLPTDWQFTPLPGDVTTAHFRKDDDNLSAFVAISTMVFTEPVSSAAFAASIAAASVHEPGFRLLESGQVPCGPEICLRRRFVVFVRGDERHPKTVEEWTLLRGNKGFVLHGEALSVAFPTFVREIMTLFSSFQPIGAAELEQQQRAQLKRKQPIQLVGTWVGQGHRLELSPGGVVRWNKHRGHYKINSDHLLLHLETGAIVLRYDVRNGQLHVQGGPLAQEVILTRANPAPSSSR